MKNNFNIADIRSLLFVFDIENTYDAERETIIASKNVNNERELTEMFDILMEPEFLAYTSKERDSLICTIEYFLSESDTFDRVFEKMTTYFDDEVISQKAFMEVLLRCLRRYQENNHN